MAKNLTVVNFLVGVLLCVSCLFFGKTVAGLWIDVQVYQKLHKRMSVIDLNALTPTQRQLHGYLRDCYASPLHNFTECVNQSGVSLTVGTDEQIDAYFKKLNRRVDYYRSFSVS